MKRGASVLESCDGADRAPPRGPRTRSHHSRPSRAAKRLRGSLGPVPRSPPLRLPLTSENLRRLNVELSAKQPRRALPGSAVEPILIKDAVMMAPSSRTGSRSPTKSSVRSTQGGFKLSCFSIYISRGSPFPQELAGLAASLTQRGDAETPSARRIAQLANTVSKMSEANGQYLLRPLLVPRGALECAGDGNIPMLAVSDNANLNRNFLPEPIDATVKIWYDKLETPRPDLAVGYLRCDHAESMQPNLPCAFTAAQERAFASFDVCTDLSISFPFLTYQWKSGEGTMAQAERQAARDGATIVNNMHQFLHEADPSGQEPGMAETAHVSITCDMRTVVAWLHWRHSDGDGQVVYGMERLAQSFCNERESLAKIRDIVKNTVEYGMGKRLEAIQQALAAMTERRLGAQTSSTAALPQQNKPVPLPSPVLTSSSASEPLPTSSLQPRKKRARVESGAHVGD